MSPIVSLQSFLAELNLGATACQDVQAQALLTQAEGMASEYCGRDLSALDPVPFTVQRAILDLANALFHASGRDPALTREECEGVGSTAWGVMRWPDLLAPLDPWRVYHVA